MGPPSRAGTGQDLGPGARTFQWELAIAIIVIVITIVIILVVIIIVKINMIIIVIFFIITHNHRAAIHSVMFADIRLRNIPIN